MMEKLGLRTLAQVVRFGALAFDGRAAPA